jgi:hypothetical protein
MDEIDMIRTMETLYEPCNNRRRACAMVARAYSARSSSEALLIGWPMTTNLYAGMPTTRHMSSAALTNRSVITAMAGTP